MKKKEIEDHRPWGRYKIISETPHYKIKEVTVSPGKRMSLQRHRHRAEHWYILSGEALVNLNNKEFPLKSGQSADIFQGAIHRIGNPGTRNLIYIETQPDQHVENMADTISQKYSHKVLWRHHIV